MGALFDVFVVGPAQAAAEPTALATALAGRLGISTPIIAKALADRKLCAGRGLEAGAAQTLVRDLRGMGAMTMMRPAASTAPAAAARTPPAAGPRTPAPAPAPRRPAADGGSVRPITGGDARAAAAASAPILDPFGPPPSGDLGRAGAGPDPFAPPPGDDFGKAPPTAAADPFDAPPQEADSLSLDVALAPPKPAPPPRSVPAPARPPREAAAPEEPSLELDTGSTRTSADEFGRQPQTVGGAAALNVSRIAASSGASGLAVDSHAAADAYRIRCPKHGLLYDTRKASGCAKCLERGRKMEAAIADQARGFKIAQFEDEPIKRAFIGLAIALVIGFLPAAYHALGVGSREMHRLREEQEVVSRKAATEEIARKFEELDASVGATKSRYMRNTGLIWIVVTGGALVGWYRLT
jgi:hypothetical protein